MTLEEAQKRYEESCRLLGWPKPVWVSGPPRIDEEELTRELHRRADLEWNPDRWTEGKL